MTPEDAELAEKCAGLVDTLGSAVDWVRNNREQVRSESDSLVWDLRRSRRLMRKLTQAAQRKMCAGVFGPSQAGKSYLISTLAKGPEGKLFADFAGDFRDFLSEINPAGGKESTGLVTRFTMSKPNSLPTGYPVQLRLLSETDIVKIVGNTYFSDFLHKKAPQPEEIAQALEPLIQKRTGSRVGPLDSDDMADLQEYFTKSFEAVGRAQVLERVYWPVAIDLAPELQPHDRARLFGLIWNNAEPFTRLYQRLYAALQSLEFANQAYCSFSEALADRSKTIIDVATLDGLSGDGGDRITLVTPAGRSVALPRAEVTALTAEITIVMANKPDDFFDHTDLLDFPGYRSRYQLVDVEGELGKPGAIKEFFLRGKVAYLFERYCAERELTSMLLCVGDGPQEVQSLPQVINDWVAATHGDTPDKRTDRACVLFLVLTKFDMELKEKQGALDTAESRWSTRLHSSLNGFLGLQHSWPRQWGRHGAFNNVYWLRNPAFLARDYFDYDESNQETGLRTDTRIASYLNGLRAGFLKNEDAARHFRDPAGAWDAAMRVGDGGVTYLRDNLRPVCNPRLKRDQITAMLNDELVRLVSRLRPYWRSDDSEAERKAKQELAKRLAGRLAACAQAQRFGYLLRCLQLNDHDLYEVIFQLDRLPPAETEAGPAEPVPVAVGARIDADALLDDLFGEAPVAVSPVVAATDEKLPPPQAPKDEATARAIQIEQYWIKQVRTVADTPAQPQAIGFSTDEFNAFSHELIVASSRLGIPGAIENDFREAARFRGLRRDQLIWKQASRAAHNINRFVDWLGLDPRTTTADQRRLRIGAREIDVFQEPAPIIDVPTVGEDPSTYDAQFYRDWIAAFVDLVVKNVDFDGSTVVDREQNARLGAVLTQLSG